MNNKTLINKANILFLVVIVITLLAEVFLSLISVSGITMNIVINLLASQMIIFLPGLIYYIIITRQYRPFKIYKKIKLSSVFLFVVFTWLILPLTTALNAFSQIFTKNEVMEISGDILKLPLVVTVAIVGILGPFSEEFVFRGLIYNSLKVASHRYIVSAVISALFFGLMHLNINQFCYAFVLGIIFALINETLSSTWPSFICHAVINSQNVLFLYFSNEISKRAGRGEITEYYNNISDVNEPNVLTSKVLMIVLTLILLIISLITTTLAAILFYGICRIEGKIEGLKRIFKRSNNDNGEYPNVVTISGYCAIGICIFLMFLLEPLLTILFK